MGDDDPEELVDTGVNEAANLNLEIGAEDFDKIMPKENAYKHQMVNPMNLMWMKTY